MPFHRGSTINRPPLQVRDHPDDHHEDHRLGCGVTEFDVPERRVVDQGREDLGRVVGPAAGAGEDQVERLEGLDGGVGDDDGGGRRDEWPGDVAEALPAGGAVQIDRLVQLRRDGLQAGDVHDHHLPRVEPDLHDRQVEDRQRLVAQPRLLPGVQAEGRQDRVGQAERRVVDERPDEGEGDGRQHGGEEVQGAQEHVGAGVPLQGQGQHQRQGRPPDHDGQDELERVDHRGGADAVAAQQPLVVAQADLVAGGRESVPIGDREAERLRRRPEHQPQVDQRRRQDEQGQPPVVAGSGEVLLEVAGQLLLGQRLDPPVDGRLVPPRP
jgi:hypothetical protein